LNKERILLVEDDKSLSFLISDRLRKTGYQVETETNGAKGLVKALEGKHDLIILDVMLPDKNGVAITQELRIRHIATPILMLTALAELSDKVSGLSAGADDYLAKPFEMAELLARIQALLRRVAEYGKLESEKHEGLISWISRVPPHIALPTCDIDMEKLTITRDGQKTDLYTKEAELLACLLCNQQRILRREELFEDIWGYASDIESRTIDMHISHLRQKLGDLDQPYRYIRTMRGKGYMWIFHVNL
jgi:two-component system alkaline phosphatase synthesis response regulator PhoP